MTRKIQYISDIHLEFYKKLVSIPEIPINAEILVLAGDIGYPTLPIFWEFLEKQSLRFKHIILVTGNHEYYHTSSAIKNGRILTINQIDELISSEIKRRHLDNIYFLQCDSVIIDDIEFIGATTWSNVPTYKTFDVVNSMNDYSCIFIEDDITGDIHTATVESLNKLHMKHTAFLHDKLLKECTSDIKRIVITHHLPSYEMIHEKYKSNELNCAFASNILHTLSIKPDIWICGHSHSIYDDIIDDVRCMMNPIGYPNENKELNWGAYIEI